MEYGAERSNSKEERVAEEPDKKRRCSYDNSYKVESQKESCKYEDQSE